LRGHAGLEILEAHLHPGPGRRGHVGGDEPSRHGVRGDAERAELDGQGLGESLQPGLGRRVVNLPAATQRGAGGQVDDPAVVLVDHVLLRGPAGQERAAQVHAEHCVPVLFGHLEQQVVADHAGIVDQHRGRPQVSGHRAYGRALIFSISQGLRTPVVEDIAVIAFLGFERTLVGPAYPGDTITARWTVSQVRRSRSSPDRGVACLQVAVVNQDGTIVQRGSDTYLAAARPAGAG
jgi:hypothetical protein